MDINLLNIWRKGLRVERMHTVQHITPYNNGFHSCNAALIAHELCNLNGIDSASVIRYMLLHDVAEGYVGDSPANLKVDYPKVKRALVEAESDWERKHIPDMPDLHVQERAIAKVSDLAELGMYCLDEINIGNREVKEVLNNVILYLQNYLGVKGASDFITHFVSRGELS